MATPTQILEAIQYTLKENVDYPSRTSWSLQQLDEQGGDSDKRLPIIELEIDPSQERFTDFNTDFSGYVTDEEDNQIGRIYQLEYSLGINLSIWTASESIYDVSELAEDTRLQLYSHDSAGLQIPLEHPELGELESVWKFTLGDGRREDDTSYSPTLRRWVQEIDVWAYNEVRTDEEYIVDFSLPEDSEVVN